MLWSRIVSVRGDHGDSVRSAPHDRHVQLLHHSNTLWLLQQQLQTQETVANSNVEITGPENFQEIYESFQEISIIIGKQSARKWRFSSNQSAIDLKYTMYYLNGPNESCVYVFKKKTVFYYLWYLKLWFRIAFFKYMLTLMLTSSLFQRFCLVSSWLWSEIMVI